MKARFVKHIPCHKCGSRDNRALYADGGEFCFGCRDYKKGSSSATQADSKPTPVDQAKLAFLRQPRYSGGLIRGLTESTRRLYGYSDFVQPDGTSFHYYGLAADTVFKLRYTARKGEACKSFSWLGSLEQQTLFGLDKFEVDENQPITITEGELDAMSYYQIYKTPAVSIINGVKDTRGIINELFKLSQFGKINLAMDADEPGEERARVLIKAINKYTNSIIHRVKPPDNYKDYNEYLNK